jgi:hypothetical protein
MFRATFNIVSETASAEEWKNSHLLMEVGDKSFCYVVYRKDPQHFLGYRQYNLEFIPGKTTYETLIEILTGDEFLQQLYQEAIVIYNYTDSNLMPEKFFHVGLNKPATELVYGNARKGLLLSEKVNGWNFYNIYRIPREVHTLMQQKFAAGKYWHYYSLLLAGVQKDQAPAANAINMIVEADQFIVLVIKDQQIQLLQTYNYQTPEDVSYQLLAICQQFGMNQEEAALTISGLIDEESNLYQELLKYFLLMKWEKLPDSIGLEETFSQYPQHYFSPLLKMALCV